MNKGAKMKKKINKYIISFGAVLTSLLLISTVSAVNNVEGKIVVEHLENNNNDLQINGKAINSEDFAEQLKDFFIAFLNSEEFANYVTSDETVSLVSELLDMTPTLLSKFNEYFSKYYNNQNLNSNEIGLDYLSMPEFQTQNLMEEFVNIFSSSLELNTQSVSVENDMVLQSTIEIIDNGKLDNSVAEYLEEIPYVDPEINTIYNELQSMFASSEFETLKSEIGEVIEQSGFIEEGGLLSIICAIIGIVVFTILIPFAFFGFNPITEFIVSSGALILAIIPAVFLGIVLGIILYPLFLLENFLVLILNIFEDVDWEEQWNIIGPGGIIILLAITIPLLLCIAIVYSGLVFTDIMYASWILIWYYAICEFFLFYGQNPPEYPF